MDSKIRIDHGLYINYTGEKYVSIRQRDDLKLAIPTEFLQLIEKVCECNPITYGLYFTLGTLETPKYRIQAIAIVSPQDQFSRKEGRMWVSTRIMDVLMILKQVDFNIVDSKKRKEIHKKILEKRPTVKVTEL